MWTTSTIMRWEMDKVSFTEPQHRFCRRRERRLEAPESAMASNHFSAMGPARRPGTRWRHQGMTLTELLVVIMILVMLLGISLPLMRTGLEGRALREASRQLNTYVQLAKSRAAETGRPVGLWLDTVSLPEEERFDPELPLRYADQLFLAETPLPYAGDLFGARVKVFENTDPDPEIDADYVARSTDDGFSATLPDLVQPGDRIKFDFKGPAYPIRAIRPQAAHESGERRVFFTPEPHQPAPRVFDPSDDGVPYQIFRAPQRSSSTPLSLTSGVLIDLTNSGYGLDNREFGLFDTPMVILFNPGGGVDAVLGNGAWFIPTGAIHLQIGSMGNLLEPGEFSSEAYGGLYNRNLEDTSNLWVTIGHRSGRVTTAENAWEDRGDLPSSLTAAREFAQLGQAMGGR